MSWNGSGATAAVEKPQDKRKPVPKAVWVAVGAIAVAVAVGGLVIGLHGTDTAVEKAPVADRKIRKNAHRFTKSPEEEVRQALPAGLGKAKPRKRRSVQVPTDLFEHLKGRDRQLAEAVQTALDADDFDVARTAIKSALKSGNPEVRQNAVEALGWFGAVALPELTGCMADPNEDVRDAAVSHWEMAVQEIEEPSHQFAVAAAAFATLSNEDQLMSIGSILSGAASEMIDSQDEPDMAAEKRTEVLQTLVDIIEGDSKKNAEAAKEVYSDITGNAWMGFDEAERYLADPDKYDPEEGVGTETVAE